MADDGGLSIEIDGEKELQQSLEQAAQALSPEGMIPPMRSATLLVTRDAKKNAPVNTGRLRASITPEVKQHMWTVQGVVGSNVKYAPFVEFGTRPHYPPLAPILFWVRRKFRLKGDALFAVARGVQRKIGRSGTKAVRYLQRAFEDNKEKIVRIFEKAVDDAVK